MTIEYNLLNYLSANLTVPVYMEEPETKADGYVIIEKTGSSLENHINNATFAVQSYGKSLQDAIDLNESVKSVMADFPNHENVFSCKLNSDYAYTDTETKRYRYQAVFVITY